MTSAATSTATERPHATIRHARRARPRWAVGRRALCYSCGEILGAATDPTRQPYCRAYRRGTTLIYDQSLRRRSMSVLSPGYFLFEPGFVLRDDGVWALSRHARRARELRGKTHRPANRRQVRNPDGTLSNLVKTPARLPALVECANCGALQQVDGEKFELELVPERAHMVAS